jgi:hypothetical protein
MLFDFLYKKIRADDMSFTLDATKKGPSVHAQKNRSGGETYMHKLFYFLQKCLEKASVYKFLC